MTKLLLHCRTLATAACVAIVSACTGDSTAPARATMLVATSPITQTAAAGTPVATPPSVRVTDQNGKTMRNVPVTFQVTGGGGAITGAAATTDASGVASATAWTLGSEFGPNTVTASVPGLTSIVFAAAAVDPCDVRTALAVGGSASGVLSAQDCQYNSGEYVDYLEVSVPTAQALTFGMTNTAFDAYLLMYTLKGTTLGLTYSFNKPSLDGRLNMYVPAGVYTLAATAGVGATGAYKVTASTFVENENCGDYWVVPGVQISGTLKDTDCDLGTHGDAYRMVVQAGETITFRMTSTNFDADLRHGSPGANNNQGGGTDALYTFTARSRGYTTIIATSATPGKTGAYTLTVTSDRDPSAYAASPLRFR